MTRPGLFISYAHEDVRWAIRIEDRLKQNAPHGLIEIWRDARIEAGDEWHQWIIEKLSHADVVIALISNSFLRSEFISSVEWPLIWKRYIASDVLVIPVLIETCDWKDHAELNQLQMTSSDREPLSNAATNDELKMYLSRLANRVGNALANQMHARFSLDEDHGSSSMDARSVSINQLPPTGPEIFGRAFDLAVLDHCLFDADTNLLSVVGLGGSGKSALVNHWLAALSGLNWPGLEKVFGWTFYSQGYREIASSDLFFESALSWFGDPDPLEGSPEQRAKRLAELVNSQPSLLILDGLEPLQLRHGDNCGRLIDVPMRTLLKELSLQNQGLCVVTTREIVTDIGHFSHTTSPVLQLPKLDKIASLDVLESRKIKGSDDALGEICSLARGHALSLILLANMLRDFFKSDTEVAAQIVPELLHSSESDLLGDILNTYDKYLSDSDEGSILHLIGFFDRLAKPEELITLLSPPVPGIREGLPALASPEWQKAVSRLRQSELLLPASGVEKEAIDAHPLIREHYSTKLRKQSPDAWREGNRRLFSHYASTTSEFPDTLGEVSSLYTAVIHGCRAGKQAEAYREVYEKRIHRGDVYYAFYNLGAYGADLATVSHFFDETWAQVNGQFTRKEQADILVMAGFSLRLFGRLKEAAEVTKRGFDLHRELKDWPEAANDACNLSVQYLAMGELETARFFAEQSVQLSDQSDDAHEQVANRVILADVYLQLGKFEASLKIYQEIERILREHEVNYDHFHQAAPPRRLNLQLAILQEKLWKEGKDIVSSNTDRDALQKIKQEATDSYQSSLHGGTLLTKGLHSFVLGKVCLLENRSGFNDDVQKTKSHIDKAVSFFEQASQQQQYLIHGILLRSTYYRSVDDIDNARIQTDFAAAMIHGEQPSVFQADIALECSWNEYAASDIAESRRCLIEAEKLVDSLSYFRRRSEIRFLWSLLEQ